MLDKSKVELRELLKQTLRENYLTVNINDWDFCIAGYGSKLIGHPLSGYFRDKFFDNKSYSTAIGEAFGLASGVFSTSFWPPSLYVKLLQTKDGTKEYVEVVCEAMDFFTIEGE